MTATVFMGGVNEFDALVYGQQHPGTTAYLQEHANRFTSIASDFSQTLTDAAKAFFQRGQELYQQFNNSDAIRAAEAAVRKVRSFFQPEIIRPLWDLGDIQTASLTMQRWIMAEPTVRSMFHQQRLDGYADTYVDMHPGDVGEQHYDYRRVMNGLVVDDEEHDWKATFYFDDLIEGDVELTLEQKVDITDTWGTLLSIIKKGEDDPTSQYGGKL